MGLRVSLAVLWALAAVAPGFAQSPMQTLSACDVQRDPARFDKKVVRARGVINLSFEDFSFTTQGCGAATAIWLMFGGDIATPTVSTVNDTDRTPGNELTINGIRYPIAKDESLRKLLVLLMSVTHSGEPLYHVTATLTGTFLAGEKATAANDGRTYFRDYGHLGCCSLFIISKVEDVESIPPASLNISGVALTRDGRPAQNVRVIDETGGCCQPQLQETTTDAKGHFEFSDAGQVLHFRRDDLRPATIIAKQGDTGVRVVLQPSKGTDWIVSACTAVEDKEKRVGFAAKVLASSAFEREAVDDPNVILLTPVKHPLISALGFEHNHAAASEPLAGTSYMMAISFTQRWIKDQAGRVIGIDTKTRWKKGQWSRHSTFLGQDVISTDGESRADDERFDRMVNTVCVEE